jgi:hypothetical protein
MTERLNSFTGTQSLEMPLVEIPELINNWVRVGDLTLLIGSSGIGKSTVSLPLGLSLAGGVDFLNCKVPSPEKVLYLDLEMGEYEFRTRLNILLPQFPNITGQNFHWLSLPSKDITNFKIDVEKDKERLINELEEIRPKLLIIDNHTRFHSGNPNSEEEMTNILLTPFSQMMSRFELAILYLMHVGWKDKKRPRGTSAILDAASTEIAVAGRSLRSRVLHWGKNRSVRRQHGPSKLNIFYNPETLMIECESETDITDIFDQIDWPIARTELVSQVMERWGVGKTIAYQQVRDKIDSGELIVEGKMLWRNR